LVYTKHYITYFKQIPLISKFVLALATKNYYTIYLIKLRYIPQKDAKQYRRHRNITDHNSLYRKHVEHWSTTTK